VSCAQAKTFRQAIPAMEKRTKFGSSLHYHFNFHDSLAIFAFHAKIGYVARAP
jgi:hypothetical protein